MTNDKRSKSATPSAIFVIWISLLLCTTIGRAQERPWEFAISIHALNTNYQETGHNPDNNDSTLLEGNSLTTAAINASLTYRARQELGIPAFLTLSGTIPVASGAGMEVQHEFRGTTTFTTAKENVRHTELTGRAQLGFELLPWLQPYIAIERSNFTSRRTDQQNGTEEGTFAPDVNPDYRETVLSTQVGFGLQGAMPLNANADIGLRYDVGYEIPQTVSVTNTYFITDNSWGATTTGYTIGGKIQLDLPFHAIALFADHNGYWSIGASLSKRHWNGDGTFVRGTENGFPVTVSWPANTPVKAGGFIGLGLFF